MNNVPDIFNKKILFVSGKGGVGKSTLCASMALLASKMGKRVLVVEIDSSERIAQIFGRKKKIGYREVEIHPNISTINIIPQEALEEYLRIRLKFIRIYNVLFKSRIFKYFTSAAPGLKELMAIGKIWHLSTRIEDEKTDKPKYDLIIVDSPATGHGILFIRIPQVVIDAVKVGPIKKEAEKITSVLWDHKKTALNIVTLAEEMPVNETIEIYNSIKKDLDIKLGYIIINGVYSSLFDKNEQKTLNDLDQSTKSKTDNSHKQSNPFIECAKSRIQRRELNLFYIKKLQSALPNVPLVEVPFIFSKNHDIKTIEIIANHLGKGLGIEK